MLPGVPTMGSKDRMSAEVSSIHLDWANRKERTTMNARSLLLQMLAVAAACSTPLSTLADVPRQVSYQGRLLENGQPVVGPVQLTLSLYDAAEGGTQLFTEDHIDVSLTNGVFSVNIGSQSPNGLEDQHLDTTTGELWLGVSVNGDPELTPRTRIVMVPYAAKARSAEQLVVPDSLDAAAVVDGVGNVGVGTETPECALHVAGNARVERTLEVWDPGDDLGPDEHLWFIGGEGSGDLTFKPRLDDGNFINETVEITRLGDLLVPTGSIGIGTDSPETALDVNGEGTVRGHLNVRAAGSPGVFIGRDTPGHYLGIQWSDQDDGASLHTGDHAFPIHIGPDAVCVIPNGNVGIGTTDPALRLTVDGGSDTAPEGGGYLQVGPSDGENLSIDVNEIMARNNGGVSTLVLNQDGGDVTIAGRGGGKLGIGKSFPEAVLDVEDDLDNLGFGLLYQQPPGAAQKDSAAIGFVTTDVTRAGMLFGHYHSGTPAIDIRDQSFGTGSPTNHVRFMQKDGYSVSIARNYDDSVTTEDVALIRQLNATSSAKALSAYSAGTGPAVFADNGGGGAALIVDRGAVGIGVAEPASALHVAGTTKTDALEILTGSDLAEPFNVNGTVHIEPGLVVCIDAERPGELRVSDQAYDPAVVGIISGANNLPPGVVLRSEGTIADGDHPVALAGRVYCWCDADAGGPIVPGNLLTTAPTPGHAMKAGDRDRAFGATIGKAMTGLESGRGLVLVLVSLQ